MHFVNFGGLLSLFGVYESTWLETGSITVQRAKNFSLRLADGLCLSTYRHDIRAKTQLEVLGRTASLLELYKLTLILQDHCGCLIAITPAPIADLSERKIEISAGNTYPVTDALWTLKILHFNSILFIKELSALRHDFFLVRNSNRWTFVLFIFFRLRSLLFIGPLSLDRGLQVGVTEQVFRFAI